MSIEVYEEINSRFELYGLIKDGMDDISNSNTLLFSEAIPSIRSKRG
jgi:hypothetical protein